MNWQLLLSVVLFVQSGCAPEPELATFCREDRCLYVVDATIEDLFGDYSEFSYTLITDQPVEEGEIPEAALMIRYDDMNLCYAWFRKSEIVLSYYSDTGHALNRLPDNSAIRIVDMTMMDDEIEREEEMITIPMTKPIRW